MRHAPVAFDRIMSKACDARLGLLIRPLECINSALLPLAGEAADRLMRVDLRSTA
jgi:hypothetical protein